MLWVQEHYKEYPGVWEERPERIEYILNYVHAESVPLNAEEAKKAIIKVHGEAYFDHLLSLIKHPKKVREDLAFHPGLYPVMLNAVNTAIKAAREYGFGIIRPPGHHAGKRPEGFCYVNNIVIAIKEVFPYRKVAILDLDAHYGNGTHYLIKDDEDVFYGSVHSKFLYPPERYPVEPGRIVLEDVIPAEMTDERFLEVWKGVIEKAREWEPEIVALSVGFDTWYEDPVMGFNVRHYTTYYKLGKMIREILDRPIFGVLEGGYHPKIGRMLQYFAKGIGWPVTKPGVVSEVFKFTREEGKHYAINEAGEIWSFETKAELVGKIDKKPGYSYQLEDDKVVERKILWMDLDEYYQKKKTGELAKLYRMGYDIKIKEDNLTLKEMDEAYNEMLKTELQNRIIEKVEVLKSPGNRTLILHLDNGKRLILREGLLVKGAHIELED
ncbi:MAG: hypothetical protein GXN92_01470 [Candidatus Micrarchaeota archaeon]|nr:hypothetical protein [Candidatus Micrarchaeota archaeon]